jgi:hypothetical protein
VQCARDRGGVLMRWERIDCRRPRKVTSTSETPRRG